MRRFLFKIYIWLKDKRKGFEERPMKILEFLELSQFWTRDKLRNYQLNKMNNLLMKSVTSNYYGEVLKDIDLPIERYEDIINRIPIITKEIAQKRDEDLNTDYFTESYLHATSGSTGVPLNTYISGLAEIYRRAGHMQLRSWWGIEQGDKSVLIMRVDTSKKNLVKRLKSFIKSRYDLNVFDLNEKTIFKYFSEIERFKPSYIRGYKSGVLELAVLMEKNGLEFKKFKLKLVIVTSEVLFDIERKIIERVLKCTVANEYGAADAGLLAFECPNGSMHINEAAQLLFTNENNELITTELYNDSLPLINYKNNDVIYISDEYCSCGRTSRLINKIEGRVTDYIRKPDGTKLNEFILMVIFNGVYSQREFKNAIKRFKIFQNKNDFLVQIIPSDDYGKAYEDLISKRMKEEIGDDIVIRFEIVDKIPREKSGKLTYFVRSN